MLQTFHMVDDFYFSTGEVHAVSGVRKRQSKARSLMFTITSQLQERHVEFSYLELNFASVGSA